MSQQLLLDHKGCMGIKSVSLALYLTPLLQAMSRVCLRSSAGCIMVTEGKQAAKSGTLHTAHPVAMHHAHMPFMLSHYTYGLHEVN